MISIKSEREIELLRIAGNIVHETREYLIPFIKEGITWEQVILEEHGKTLPEPPKKKHWWSL